MGMGIDPHSHDKDQFKHEKVAFEQSHKRVQSFHSSEPVQLNIGGKKFCTTLDTLKKYRDSFFGAMFSGHISLKATQKGAYFIDRDGTHFHYILNFLRTGELIVPQNKPHLIKMLLVEAEFYQIEELISKLGGKNAPSTPTAGAPTPPNVQISNISNISTLPISNVPTIPNISLVQTLPSIPTTQPVVKSNGSLISSVTITPRSSFDSFLTPLSPIVVPLSHHHKSNDSFPSSTILPHDKPQYCEKLNEWAGCSSDQKWKLIYKGSRDGFQGPVFHQKCDNQGATYSIVKSGKSIFGGYNPSSWLSNVSWSNGNGSFLFSLVNIYDIAPTKLRNIDAACGAANYVSYLPLFGGGSDLRLYDDCNANEFSHNKFKSYENPTTQPYLLTGSQKFKVDEIEVFSKV